MNRLRLTTVARRDLTEAVAHISDENPAAAKRLRARLEEAATGLLSFPSMGTQDGEAHRSFVVPGTRFTLIYRSDERGILILRVHHGARQWPPAT